MLDYISSSIRRKLTFVMLGTAVVALLVTATAMIIYEARTYHQTWVDDLVTQAEIIGKTSAPALSFDDAKALRILQNIRRTIPDDGRILLVEVIVPEDDSPHFSKLVDMEMLVSVGGRERTAAEYTDLLERAGFHRRRVVSTASPVSVIEAEPI